MYTLTIEHCSDQDFLDRFRVDLSNSGEEVVILSPFLSRNRAIHYYPILMSLTARGVKVDVYTKPQNEQPESLREPYWQVESGLIQSGVSVHTRSGMHEKVGIVDNQILWHGSLNILSHSNTRESMLRFESTDLVQEIIAELQLGLEPATTKAVRGENTGDDELMDSPPCPICAGRMISYERAGMWICQKSPDCAGSVPLSASHQLIGDVKLIPQVQVSCPLCGTPMEISRGIFLRVICPSSDCGFSLDPRIASSLLRVLKRRGIV
jgi:PLD-like domain